MAIFQVIPAGDLAMSSGTFVFETSGPAFVRQKLSSRFKFFLGEWFLDLRQGVPYYRDVFVKSPDLGVIRSLFRRVVLRTPGVASVNRFDVVFNEANRSLAFSFEARLKSGEPVIVTPSDRDFIVST